MPNLNDIMEMMDALETKAIITIPTFCVAVRNRHSSCRKCVDACLADAITIEKNELNIERIVVVEQVQLLEEEIMEAMNVH